MCTLSKCEWHEYKFRIVKYRGKLQIMPFPQTLWRALYIRCFFNGLCHLFLESLRKCGIIKLSLWSVPRDNKFLDVPCPLAFMPTPAMSTSPAPATLPFWVSSYLFRYTFSFSTEKQHSQKQKNIIQTLL